MTTTPLVSIVTCCYNHEPYLDDYFQGLLSQTYTNVELLFIDDGSTDRSWEKAKSYESRLRAKFPKVILLWQSNIGAFETSARVQALATGDFVCLLDSDDYYHPSKIEENVSYLTEHPDIGLVHSDVDIVRDKGSEGFEWRRTGPIPTGAVFEELLKSNFVMTCTACFRRALLEKYARLEEYISRGYLMGDFPMWLDLAFHTNFGYIDRPLACHRVLVESASRSRDMKKTIRFRDSYHRMREDYIRDYLQSDPETYSRMLDTVHLLEFWMIAKSICDARRSRVSWRDLTDIGRRFGELATRGPEAVVRTWLARTVRLLGPRIALTLWALQEGKTADR